jgi:hypothetical protein
LSFTREICGIRVIRDSGQNIPKTPILSFKIHSFGIEQVSTGKRRGKFHLISAVCKLASCSSLAKATSAGDARTAQAKK